MFYLPLASDQSIYKSTQNHAHYKYDIGFLGTTFENRLSFIDSIANHLNEKYIYYRIWLGETKNNMEY